jgi:hypothetical protein
MAVLPNVEFYEVWYSFSHICIAVTVYIIWRFFGHIGVFNLQTICMISKLYIFQLKIPCISLYCTDSMFLLNWFSGLNYPPVIYTGLIQPIMLRTIFHQPVLHVSYIRSFCQPLWIDSRPPVFQTVHCNLCRFHFPFSGILTLPRNIKYVTKFLNSHNSVKIYLLYSAVDVIDKFFTTQIHGHIHCQVD